MKNESWRSNVYFEKGRTLCDARAEQGGKGKKQVKHRAENCKREPRGSPSAPIQLYFSIINAYIVTFVNGRVSEGRTDG